MQYTITIQSAPFSALSSPSDGFIRFKSDGASYPSSKVNVLKAERGNRRLRNILLRLGNLGRYDIVSQTANGGDINTIHTSIVLVIEFKDAVRLLDGGQVYVGDAAIKRTIANALVVSETRNIDYYDPTPVNITSYDVVKQIPKGIVIESISIGSLGTVSEIEAAITIS